VADEDRDKTTFFCHEGAYCYIRLPFGLSNAPATFKRAIDMILGGLKWKSCLLFPDDIIVYTQSAGEHVEHLWEVFTALRVAGVSLKAKKCHLFQEEVEYLGHIVGRGELKVQDKNIRVLKEASPPRCKKYLRCFLGMCNVYLGFVKDSAQEARSLAAMTSSKRPDRWGMLSDEALGALEELKRRLTEAPILALARRQGTYTLDTDASAGQVGAVLLQEQPDQSTRPVGCWSRSLNAAERTNSTTERKFLAFVWASLPSFPTSKGPVSCYARTTRRSSGCCTWTKPTRGWRSGGCDWRSSTTWYRRASGRHTTRRTRCHASQHPRETKGRYTTRFRVWLCATHRPRGNCRQIPRGDSKAP